MSFGISDALGWVAQAGTPVAGAAGAGGAQQTGPNPMVIALIVIMVMGYFMLMRPNKQEQQKRQEMLNTLGKGDAVVTTGGIIGTVESVDAAKGTVTVCVAPKISITFTKAAIATVTARKNKGKSEETEAAVVKS